jgi:hypothetical protein
VVLYSSRHRSGGIDNEQFEELDLCTVSSTDLIEEPVRIRCRFGLWDCTQVISLSDSDKIQYTGTNFRSEDLIDVKL